MSMTEQTARAPRRALSAALIAAVVCVALVCTASAAVYLMGSRDALERIFRMGTYDWSVSADHQYSRQFLDMFDENYVTYVDQTVQGGDMDITLVSAVGVQDDHCYTLGYLLRFTLPEGVNLDTEVVDNSGYGFADGDKSAWLSDGYHWTRYNPWELEPLELLHQRVSRYSVCLLETEEPNTYYGYLTEVYFDKQLFELSDGRVTLELGSFTDGTDILAEGHWLFTFEAADIPQARQLIDQTAETADGIGEVTSLTVSPLGIDVVLYDDMDSGEWLDRTTISLVMADGTVEQPAYFICRGSPASSANYNYRENLFCFFDALIDLEQVSAVRVGGTEFPLN